MSKGSVQSRNWWFVQLVENLPLDWRDLIYDSALPCCYILHDRDKKPSDFQSGELVDVAPHVHFIVSFSGNLRAGTVLSRLPESFGVLHVEPVSEKVGACNYLLHQLPSCVELGYKEEYLPEELHMINGFKVNLSDVAGVDFTDIYDLIISLQITDFSQLVSIVIESYPSFLQYLTSHSNFVRNFVLDYSRTHF